MISTLHKYLTRDLVMTTVLSAGAFTVVMTTFAVIEPLRKQGLGGVQLLSLFWYLLPVMLSLTLPIAGVFATTFVYGRFSMDNELTACKASGVSVYSLLKPAIVMGLIIGAFSLMLSNWIAPALVRRGAEMVGKNIRGLVFQKLRTEQKLDPGDYRELGSWILHADGTDTSTDQLQGIVVVDAGSTDNVRYYTASRAFMEFFEIDGTPQMTVVAINGAYGDQTGKRVYETGRFTFGPYPMAMSFREKPSFYTWTELNEILADPRKSTNVQQILQRIHKQMLTGYFCEDMTGAINRDLPYELVDENGEVYQFRAPRADIRKDVRVQLSGAGPAGDSDYPVIIEQSRPGEPTRIRYYCRSAMIESKHDDKTKLSVTLKDVSIAHLGDAVDAPRIGKDEHVMAVMNVPEHIHGKMTGVTLENLYQHPEAYPIVKDRSAYLRNRIKNKITPRIIAEIHGRLAYGFGCILLAPLGAALGLIYRGGHVLSAFALCCIPAVGLIVMIVMGKQMVSNPSVDVLYGKAAIWSGVTVLAGTTAYLYGVILRR